MDELFTLIGKLYVDLVQSQKYIDSLQKKIQSTENLNNVSVDTKDIN
jgi:hypothetical protein